MALCPTLQPMLAEAALLVALSVRYGDGVEACLGAAQLSRSVEKRLRRKVFVEPAQAQLRFVVSFERRGAETEARVDVSNMDGQKRGSRSLVTSGHCSALDDSLALSVALLVDQPPEPELEDGPPLVTATSAPASVAPAVSPPPTPVAPRAKPQPTTITIPPEVEAPREPWHVRVGVVGNAILGALPGVRPGFALYSKLVPRGVAPILIQGEIFARATAERDATSGAHFRSFRVGLALCPVLSETRARALSLCFGQKVGWLAVEGYGFDHPARERRLTYAVILGVEGRLRLAGPVSLRGYLGAEVPVVRDQFASSGRNATRLFQASPVALGSEIGLEVELW